MSSKRLMQIFLAGLAGIYVIFLVGLVVFQRQLMYFPSGPLGAATAFGLTETQTLRLETKRGPTIVAWFHPPAHGKSIFLYFHGNGGTLGTRADLLKRLAADGSGFMAVDYEGYGGSTGTPSEVALLDDGDTAYAELRARGYPADRIVALGESLGTGVAVAVAATHPVKALILDAAYSATVDVAASQYWVFPVRLLMIDTFKSIDRIKSVKAPKLFLHGTEDPIIPIAFGRKLFDAASEPKTFLGYDDRGHMVMWVPGVIDTMKAWLAEQTPTVTPIDSALLPPR